MPTRTALFTQNRRIALGIAKEYYLPGFDADDVRQEAMVALWQATAVYDPEKGPFRAIANIVIRRHLQTLVTAAHRMKRKAAMAPWIDDPADVRDRIAARLLLLDMARADLSPLEQKALQGCVDGVPARITKQHDNALQRARQKLRKEM